uniref:Uncharacterized protein n=1 Tax=Neobodo designis TaxID=312471 RepID=A0A7S1LQQ4_NEODS|mmetsp:Transcript_26590/g.82213  ORF Transcript_26590/g.82213 Transcript_26590/m.82213 type:complete len:493 (+) Transcript_26590:68-1546(+)|eukprot:CAMPEP_0174854850 /NCGR_PEP_ID=MMETSP1114-20130205/31981_1 /TAXON_ID=312471 /ORGANISM="Neobodo designis, Strain CCAP 1951/1" /LENGTH=492 /DNA_ID=CAMNT_0016089561 /DNA_START=68 /DNA_END=1546 /DNA_ORIENTATION=+
MSSSINLPPDESRTKDVYCAALNADASVFAVGKTDGIEIYSGDPFTLLRSHKFPGGARQIAFFGQSNVLAIVPGHQRNRVWLWDDTRSDPRETREVRSANALETGIKENSGFRRASNTSAASSTSPSSSSSPPHQGAAPPTAAATSGAAAPTESPTPLNVVAQLDLPSDVLAVKLHRRCILVTTRSNAFLFNASLQRVCTWEVHPPAAAAASIQALDTSGEVKMAFSGPTEGLLVFLTYTEPVVRPANATVTNARQPAPSASQRARAAAMALTESCRQVHCTPHDHTLAVVALTHDGTHAVTASIRGTALKLSETRTGNVLRQFNRGATTNKVLNVCFSPAGNLIACTSETGTVHMFNSGVRHSDKVKVTNPRSRLTAVAQAVGDAGSFAGASGAMRHAVDFATGEFAFATFSIAECDPSDERRIFKATLAAFKPGVRYSRAEMLIAQADWGRLFKVAVDVSSGAEASADDGRGGTSRSELQWTARFPEQEL